MSIIQIGSQNYRRRTFLLMSMIQIGYRDHRRRGLLPPFNGTPPPVVGVQAARAYDVSNNIGVCCHIERTGTNAYADFTATKQALGLLGMRVIRNGAADNQTFVDRVNDLWTTMSVKTLMILGRPANLKPSQWPAAMLTSLLSRGLIPEAVAGYEAANEPNLAQQNGLPGASGIYTEAQWLQALQDHTQELWDTVNNASRPLAVRNTPVLGPSYGGPSNTTRMQTMDDPGVMDWDATSDWRNLHKYQFDIQESGFSTTLASTAQYIFQDTTAPIWATETGWHTLLDYAGGHRPTTIINATRFAPKNPMAWFALGVTRQTFYELLDEFDPLAGNEEQAHFGQFYYKAPATGGNFTPKPQALAIANLMGLYADWTNGAAYSPGKLDYSLSGGGADLRHLLHQRSDGKFLLALWRDVSLWTWTGTPPNYGTDKTVTAQNIVVDLGRTAATVDVYRPSSVTGGESGSFLASALTSVSSVTVSLSKSMAILAVSPT